MPLKSLKNAKASFGGHDYNQLVRVHSVLRVVLTLNISNIKKEGGFDSRIYV